MDIVIARNLLWPKKKTLERVELITSVVVVATDVPGERVGIVGGRQVVAGGCPVRHIVLYPYGLRKVAVH